MTNIMKNIKYLIITPSIVLILFLVWFFVFRTSEEKTLINQGNVLVSQVESFRSENGRLPESLEELGIVESEGGPFFYKKRGDSNYVIFFSISFDDIKGYYSDTGKWEDGYR